MIHTGTVVVVIASGALTPRAIRQVESVDAPMVIAADGGLDHAVAAGFEPTVVVGDLDSISAAGKMWAYAHRVEIDRYPQDKDVTDTALALQRAVKIGGSDLLVVGGQGDRFDHLLGTLLALGAPDLGNFNTIRAVLGDVLFYVVHHQREVRFNPAKGRLFSLLALHGICRGVTVQGARWPLENATLEPGATLGVSNEAIAEVQIAVTDGILTVVLP